MEGRKLGEFLDAQIRRNNLGRGYVVSMRGRHRLVIEMKELPPETQAHASPTRAKAMALAGHMRKTRVLSYAKWARAGWNVKDIAAARRILAQAGEIEKIGREYVFKDGE